MSNFRHWMLVAVVAASMATTGCIFKKEVKKYHMRPQIEHHEKGQHEDHGQKDQGDHHHKVDQH